MPSKVAKVLVIGYHHRSFKINFIEIDFYYYYYIYSTTDLYFINISIGKNNSITDLLLQFSLKLIILKFTIRQSSCCCKIKQSLCVHIVVVLRLDTISSNKPIQNSKLMVSLGNTESDTAIKYPGNHNHQLKSC